MKKLLLLFIVIVFVTGCTKPDHYTEREVLSFFEERYGYDYELVSKEQLSEDEFIYKLHSDYGFDFEINAGIEESHSDALPFSTYYNYIDTDYLEKLFENEEKIKKFIEDNRDIINAYYTSDIISDEFDFELILNNYNGIERLNSFLYDFKNLMVDSYYFTPEGLSNISVEIYNNDSDRLFIEELDKVYKLSEAEHLMTLNYYYIDEVKKGNIVDNEVTEEVLNEYKPLYIRNVYINDILYEDDVPYVIYGINIDEYYVLYSEEIFLHENLIVNGLSGNYEIADEPEGILASTTIVNVDYNIGELKYKVYYELHDDVLKNNYYFKRNNKKLDVEFVEPVFSRWLGKSYLINGYYIKIDDWALLLNADYKIENDTLYFYSK